MVNVVHLYVSPSTDIFALQNYIKTLDKKVVHVLHFNVLTVKFKTYDFSPDERKLLSVELKNFSTAFQMLLKNYFKNVKPAFEIQWTNILARFTKSVDGQLDAVTGKTLALGLQSDLQKYIDANKYTNLIIYPIINEFYSMDTLSHHYYEKGTKLSAYVGSEIKLIPSKDLEDKRLKRKIEKKKLNDTPLIVVISTRYQVPKQVIYKNIEASQQ